MSAREIANLCCRVLAVYAILQGVGRLSYAIALLFPLVQTRLSASEAVLGAIIGALEPVLWLMAGAFLWRWSGLVAAWMIGTDLHDHRNEPATQPAQVSPPTLYAIAFATVGVWVLADALPRIAGDVVQLIGMRFSGETMSPPRAPAWIGAIAEHALRLTIGLWLLFGASGLVRMLRGVRDVGLEQHERPDFPAR